MIDWPNLQPTKTLPSKQLYTNVNSQIDVNDNVKLLIHEITFLKGKDTVLQPQT